MMRFLLVSTFSLATASCTSTTSPPTSTPRERDVRPPATVPGGIDGPPVQSVEASTLVGQGEPREVTVLVDEPAIKLVRIVLRAGAMLPEHHSEVPVTIMALHGAGTVTAGGQPVRLDTNHPLVLAAKVTHAVVPDAGTDLVLLVHHLGRVVEHHGEVHAP